MIASLDSTSPLAEEARHLHPKSCPITSIVSGLLISMLIFLYFMLVFGSCKSSSLMETFFSSLQTKQAFKAWAIGKRKKSLIWMNLTDYPGLFLQASICGMNYSSNLLRYICYIVTYLYDKLKQLVHLQQHKYLQVLQGRLVKHNDWGPLPLESFQAKNYLTNLKWNSLKTWRELQQPDLKKERQKNEGFVLVSEQKKLHQHECLI